MPQKLLTPTKTDWLRARDKSTVKGLPLNPNASAEARYYKKLADLVRLMTDITAKSLERFYERPEAEVYFSQDASVAAQAKILLNAMWEKFENIFDIRSKPIADSVVKDAGQASQTSLKMSLKQLSGGLTLKTDILSGPLKDIITASIAENVDLIKSIPAQYHKAVSGAVFRSITTGNGLKDLIPYLDRYKGITLRRARFIAEDQTRKAYNTINKGRLEQIGVGQYEWLHTGGSQHPRKLHQQMSGNIYSFDKPPIIDKRTGERGIPGQLPNCRCRMVPVIKFNED